VGDIKTVAVPHGTYSGRLLGLHSVSINLSYRITIELMIHDNEIIPINVGDHNVVY